MRVSSVQQMRDLDKNAIARYGITQEMLMENAGQAVYFTILRQMGMEHKKFVFFCGGGNNGGDGLVVARKVHSNGGRVTVFLLSDPAKYKGSALLNYQIAQKLGFPLYRLQSIEEAVQALRAADVIVDAIFGTGLDRPVEGIYKTLIEQINQSGKTIVSVDIPSGVNGNNGQILSVAVKADYTITFGLAKYGNLLYPGFKYNGNLSVTHISFPPELYNEESIKVSLNIPLPLPIRRADAHKGSVGKALFIAGSGRYLGAPYFSAMSFLKSGGGLSFLATPQTVSSQIVSNGPEIIIRPQQATEQDSLSLKCEDDLAEFAATTDFVVLGPGLSLAQETQTLVRNLCRKIQQPLLIDGDGLTAMATDADCLRQRQAVTILTPHLGEMSRLINKPIEEISRDPIGILQETCQDLRAIIVLKGAHSLIGLPDGRVFINLSGNAGMATAGSGDVLTGTIAAMYGLGLNVEEAVKAGVFMHGLAGDLAAEKIGEDGITAGDLLSHLPQAVVSYRSQYTTLLREGYGKVHLI